MHRACNVKINEYTVEHSVSARVWVCVPWYLPTLALKAACASQHLFILRFKQHHRAANGDRVAFSSCARCISSLPPIWQNLPASSSHHVSFGIPSKIFAGSCAKLSFSLGSLWRCKQRSCINLTGSKSPNKLMYELEEWKRELLPMMILMTWTNLWSFEPFLDFCSHVRFS